MFVLVSVAGNSMTQSLSSRTTRRARKAEPIEELRRWGPWVAFGFVLAGKTRHPGLRRMHSAFYVVMRFTSMALTAASGGETCDKPNRDQQSKQHPADIAGARHR